MTAISAVAVVVLGKNSPRTIDVLRTLAHLHNISWLASQSAILSRLTCKDVACVVIADDLEEASSLDLLRHIRQHKPDVPIYLVTETDAMADAVAGMRLGAAAAIEIPPCYELLRDCVSKALDGVPDSKPRLARCEP